MSNYVLQIACNAFSNFINSLFMLQAKMMGKNTLPCPAKLNLSNKLQMTLKASKVFENPHFKQLLSLFNLTI